MIARYADGPLPGTPALTRRPVGDGVAWYVGDPAGRGRHRGAGRPAHPARPGCGGSERAHPDVELVRRAHDPAAPSYLFVLNRGTEPVTVPGRGRDLLSAAHATGSVEVAAGQAAVLREADD